jgi:hypothetical protein
VTFLSRTGRRFHGDELPAPLLDKRVGRDAIGKSANSMRSLSGETAADHPLFDSAPFNGHFD